MKTKVTMLSHRMGLKHLGPLFSDDSLHANLFSEVFTKHKQLKYLRKHFKFIVSHQI